MTRNLHNSPRNRLRNILQNGEAAESIENDRSPLSRLPKASTPPSSTNYPRVTTDPSDTLAYNQGSRLSFSRLGPAFWTVTGIISLVVNGILTAFVLYILSSLTSLQLTASDAGSNVLSGLYTNFEKMDRASITSIIPVDTEIPLSINLPIRETTTITLASDAIIPNARVQITSPALNIDAPAQVTLPAGTTLNISLDMSVPVQTTIPVHLEVPVNIPLSQTQLHEPFSGLQEVIRPFYCLIEPNAMSLDGQPVCR